MRTHPSSVSRKRSAFTLVEIMVVIGIIGVLIAIALPAYSRVKLTAQRAATQATIEALRNGLENYRADSQFGGSYPPSYGTKGVVANPHVPGSNRPVAIPELSGASLLFWALAGADQLGTPGFRNVDGVGDPYGGWVSDTSAKFVPANPMTSGLYARYLASDSDLTRQNQPVYKRTGPLVDMSSMKVLTATTASPPTFPLTELKTQTPEFLWSNAFLDSWKQPILYYRANLSKPQLADCKSNPAENLGIYNLFDNWCITGAKDLSSSAVAEEPGTDFGLGLANDPENPAQRKYYHKIGSLGRPATATEPLKQGSFFYAIQDATQTSLRRPQNPQTFILLSAGPDGVFGTGDDLGNFTINP